MAKKASDKIAAGLEDVLAYVEGAADLSRDRVHVPADVDVEAIGTVLKMSQERFANTFGFPLGTLRD